MGQHTFRISIQQSDTDIELTLEGRLAGPWVSELERAWSELSDRLDSRKVRLDLRNVTYSDSQGKTLLRQIFRHTHAEMMTSSQWSQYLADEIRNKNSGSGEAEV